MKDGGPAFPRAAHSSMTYEDLGSDGADPQDGMSLRDYFAGQALVGFLANPGVSGGIKLDGKILPHADACYAMADAMLAVRRSA